MVANQILRPATRGLSFRPFTQIKASALRASAFSPAKVFTSIGVRKPVEGLQPSVAGVREEMGGKQWLLLSKEDEEKKSVPKGFEKFGGGKKDVPASKDSKKEE